MFPSRGGDESSERSLPGSDAGQRHSTITLRAKETLPLRTCGRAEVRGQKEGGLQYFSWATAVGTTGQPIPPCGTAAAGAAAAAPQAPHARAIVRRPTASCALRGSARCGSPSPPCPVILAQQLPFDAVYGDQVSSTTLGKGSWLARVSHRASHIPNPRPVNPPTNGPTNATFNSSSSSHSVDTGRNNSITASLAPASASLPLRTHAFGAVSHEQLSTTLLHRTASYPASPISPALSTTETEFTSTPIDPGFGDRITDPSPIIVPPAPPVIRRNRSGTATLLNSNRGIDERMDKYARQAGDNTYDSDAEADDEFERSVFSSPIIAGHFADDQSDHPSDSEDDHSLADGEDTPTTQGWADREGRSPTGKITQWSEEEVADYIASLSPALVQYGQRFVEEGVNGEALIALHHDELRELGVASVGHRLTILKAVYEQKLRAGVKIDESDYVPLSAEGEKADANATQDDVSRIIESIRLRDQRIIAAEAELRVMKQDLDRISEENRKLREETLPIMRLVKDQRTPLPDPAGGTVPSPRETEHPRQLDSLAAPQVKGSSLSRKFSTKKLFLKSEPTKQPSPTHPPPAYTLQPREVRDDGGTHLEASAAAVAASSHLTASMTAQTSPISAHGQQLSPVSPAYSTQAPNSGGSYGMNRSFPRENNVSRHEQRVYNQADETGTGFSTSSQWSQASTVVAGDQANVRERDRPRRQAPTPSPREDETPGSGRDRDNPQVEIFKSFRVSIDDPCRVVLPVALKRYNITDDWRQYALYIVHGDQERCLGLEEKPLLLFKQLDKEGRKPMFMLRRHASPQEGWSGAAGGGIPSSSGEAKIPGGVL